MKYVLFVMLLLPLFAKADAVYDKFLDLKAKCKAEKGCSAKSGTGIAGCAMELLREAA